MIIKKNFFLYIFIIWYTVDILTSISSEKFLGVPLFQIDRVVSIIVLVFLFLQIVFFQKYEIAEIIVNTDGLEHSARSFRADLPMV